MTRTTRRNTRVIPGSHLWGPNRFPVNDVDNVCYVELEKGDCTFILGSTYHAASSNLTQDDRISSFYFMAKNYLKQEENLFMDINFDYFKRFSSDTLKLLGLGLSGPFCGHIDYNNPISLLESKSRIKESEFSQDKNYTDTIYRFFT